MHSGFAFSADLCDGALKICPKQGILKVAKCGCLSFVNITNIQKNQIEQLLLNDI